MACDDMRVRLHLRETRVLRVRVDTPNELRVEVESTVVRGVWMHCTRRREIRDQGGVGAAYDADVAPSRFRVRQLRALPRRPSAPSGPDGPVAVSRAATASTAGLRTTASSTATSHGIACSRPSALH